MIQKLIFGLIGLLAIGNVHAADTNSPVVVELFTSQGCSSCPPADAVLSRLAQRGEVLALSFHVDYWDNLGWTDPFASPLNTARQKAYRVTFHNAQIYTPQMVIGGMLEMPGQNMSAVTSGIADVSRRRPPGPKLTIDRAGNNGVVTVTILSAEGPASTVWVAAYDPRHETAVRRGENAGSALVNTNVVRKFVALGPFTGNATTLSTPRDFVHEDEGVAAWVQANPTGTIVSAGNAPPR